MDPHRNLPEEYGKDSESSWYPGDGERAYPDPEWEPPGADARHLAAQAASEQRYDDDRYRVPEPRGGAHAGPVADSQPAGISRYADLIPDPGGRDPGSGAVSGAGYGGRDPGSGAVSGTGYGAAAASIGPRSGAPLPPFEGGELPSFDGFAAVTPPAGVLPPRPGPPPDAAPGAMAPPGPLPPAFAPPGRGSPNPFPPGPYPPGAGQPGSGQPPPGTVPPPFPYESPEELYHYQTEPIDRSAPRRAPGGPATFGDGVYRSRRPALAAILIAATVVLVVAPVRLLVEGVVHAQVNAAVAATFLMMGLPMFALGLYALLGGVTTAPGQSAGVRAWLRTPLVYLPVALILFTAAGLAA